MERTYAEELRKKYGVELGERIGRGAFGEVYRATGSGGACAIKRSLDPVDIFQAWVIQELEGLKLVKRVKGHPHIVTLFDVWRVQGYLVTRWELGQQSLADRLKECQNQGLPGIPREELLPYMEQAALAIDFLNGQGIYHRDIKPENLVLFHGYVKLADLGLAKFIGASTCSHSGFGTLGYTPPEAHEDRLTKSSDLYALAATYIKLRTGHEPFGSNPMEIMKRQEAAQPILDGLDEVEKEAVGHAIAYRPEDRPQAAQAWVKLLAKRDLAPPVPVPKPPSSSPLHDPESAHSRRLRLLRGMNQLLERHETTTRIRSLSEPLIQCIVLGVIASFGCCILRERVYLHYDNLVYELLSSKHGSSLGGEGGELHQFYQRETENYKALATVLAVFVGLTFGSAAIWLRMRLWRKSVVRAELNLSIKIEELQAEFFQECQMWGGLSALRDRDLVRDLFADLKRTR